MGYMVLDTMHIQGILSEGIEGAMNLENLVLREFGQNPMKDGRTMTSYIGQNAQMCGRSIGVVMAHLHYRTIVETEGKVCTGTKSVWTRSLHLFYCATRPCSIEKNQYQRIQN